MGQSGCYVVKGFVRTADRGATNLEHTDGIDKINRYDFGEVFF
jgi:hypothetical protein